MHRLPGYFFCLLVFFLVGTSPVQGLTIAAPSSDISFSSSGKRAFVYLSAELLKSDHSLYKEMVTLPDGRKGNLSELFQESGVYDLETGDLLWRMDGYDEFRSFYSSGEFEYWVMVTNMAPYDEQDPGKPALMFYHRDQLLRTWSFHELLRPTNTHQAFTRHDWFMSEWYETADIIDSSFVIISNPRYMDLFFDLPLGGGETFIFDLESGRLLKEKRRPMYGWAYPAGLLLVIVLGTCIWRIIRHHT